MSPVPAAATEPGYVVLAIRDKEVVRSLTWGVADMGIGDPMTIDTVCYVGSLAKQVVAACVALLEHDAQLDVDDPVARWVPGLPSWAERATVRHLVHHTSGLPAPSFGPDGLGPGGVRALSTDDRLQRVKAVDPLPSEPGERYVYSNHGYLLLAEVVAAAAKAPLSVVARERVFEPLDMSSSFFRDTPDVLPPGTGRGHFRATDGTRHVEPGRFHAVGAGGLWTTARDLGAWSAMFDDDPITGGWLPAHLSERGRLHDGSAIHYAWGMSSRTHHGLPIFSHNGSFPGWSATMVRFPGHRTTAICLANTEDIDAGAIAFSVADQVLANAIDPSAPHADHTRLFDTLTASHGS